MFISVDLPAPEAPTMATNSPDSIVRSTSRSTVVFCSPAAKRRVTPVS